MIFYYLSLDITPLDFVSFFYPNIQFYYYLLFLSIAFFAKKSNQKLLLIC